MAQTPLTIHRIPKCRHYPKILHGISLISEKLPIFLTVTNRLALKVGKLI